ncbi:MAG: DUF4114 domain-containing protein [Microcoleaceae cyanobacterium]
MKFNFSSTLLAATTVVLSSFTLMGTASAVSFDSPDAQNNFDSIYEYLRDHELDNLDTTMAPGNSTLVDLNNLFLNHSSDISITFLGEGTVKKNDLSYNVNGGANTTIWNDINGIHGSASDFLDTETDPTNGTMTHGETMNLGSFNKGDQFEFMLTPEYSGVDENGVKREGVVYSSITGNSVNSDGLQHAIGYAFNNRYMILGFEDLYGESGQARSQGGENSDRDFNDVLFLVDLGEGNVSVPEPATASALFAAGALGLFGVRRKKNSI